MPVRQVIEGGRVPVKVFTDDVEAHARQQLANVARLPIVFGHVAAMPDVHAGIGATVGSVIPTRGAIIPAAVGVDIGCFIGDTKVPLLDETEVTLRRTLGVRDWLESSHYRRQSHRAAHPGKRTVSSRRVGQRRKNCVHA